MPWDPEFRPQNRVQKLCALMLVIPIQQRGETGGSLGLSETTYLTYSVNSSEILPQDKMLTCTHNPYTSRHIDQAHEDIEKSIKPPLRLTEGAHAGWGGSWVDWKGIRARAQGKGCKVPSGLDSDNTALNRTGPAPDWPQQQPVMGSWGPPCPRETIGYWKVLGEGELFLQLCTQVNSLGSSGEFQFQPHRQPWLSSVSHKTERGKRTCLRVFRMQR